MRSSTVTSLVIVLAQTFCSNFATLQLVSFHLCLPADGLQPVPVDRLQPMEAPKDDLQPAPVDGLQPGPPSDSEMTPQEFLRIYGSEQRLIPLKRLGVSQFNRKGKRLNGAQVITLMRRFRNGSKGGGEDFQAYRYRPARVVEPDPSDPGETERLTNSMAAIDHRIRSVEDPTKKGLYGLFFKISYAVRRVGTGWSVCER